jgi:hypothetical protein
MNGIGAHTGQTYIHTFIFIYIDIRRYINQPTNMITSAFCKNISFISLVLYQNLIYWHVFIHMRGRYQLVNPSFHYCCIKIPSLYRNRHTSLKVQLKFAQNVFDILFQLVSCYTTWQHMCFRHTKTCKSMLENVNLWETRIGQAGD